MFDYGMKFARDIFKRNLNLKYRGKLCEWKIRLKIWAK
jgi:hypothetical protein